MESGGSSFWAVIFIVGFIYWFTGDDDTQVTSYSAKCENDAVVAPLYTSDKLGMKTSQLRASIEKCAVWATSKTVFSLNRTLETVTYRIGDLPVLYQQEGCKMLDNENWSCPYANGSGNIGFRDGLRALPDDEVPYGFFYQKRWQHLITRALNMVAGPVVIPMLIPDQVTPY